MRWPSRVYGDHVRAAAYHSLPHTRRPARKGSVNHVLDYQSGKPMAVGR